jgi:chromosome segregation ATPase
VGKREKHAGEEARRGGWGELGRAAEELERELARFDELTASARRMPLDTQKAIQRAAKATTETASGQERVDRALGALVQAIAAVRTRHEANAAALVARGEEIGRRAEELAALQLRFDALGEEGRIINQLVHDAASAQRGATSAEEIAAFIATIEGVEERMTRLVEGAREVGQAAVAASITDLAEQADALRQQVAAARNKMGLLRKSLLEQPPSRKA